MKDNETNTSFLRELKILATHVASWFFTLVGFSLFFFAFGMKEVSIYGKTLLLPLPSQQSFSVWMFNMIRGDVLPPEVELIVTNPMSAFVSQISLSLLLGFLAAVPFLIYKIILYIQPALLPREKNAVILSIFPFVLLFFCGAAFSYYFLIPATFAVLYPYATTIGAVPYFAVDEFAYYISSLMVAAGFVFLLPLFMILLSVMGVIDVDYWRRKWRYALLFFLILSAIITPDGSGITMVILFIPLMMLYFSGYLIAKKLRGGTIKREVELPEA